MSDSRPKIFALRERRLDRLPNAPRLGGRADSNRTYLIHSQALCHQDNAHKKLVTLAGLEPAKNSLKNYLLDRFAFSVI